MESADDQQKYKDLEKEIRILKKKLTRSEADRIQLEESSERNEGRSLKV